MKSCVKGRFPVSSSIGAELHHRRQNVNKKHRDRSSKRNNEIFLLARHSMTTDHLTKQMQEADLLANNKQSSTQQVNVISSPRDNKQIRLRSFFFNFVFSLKDFRASEQKNCKSSCGKNTKFSSRHKSKAAQLT